MHQQDQQGGGEASGGADPKLAGESQTHEADQTIEQGRGEQQW